MQVQLPVFTRAMRVVAVVFGVVWVLQLLLGGTRFLGAQTDPFAWLALVPERVLRGEVWRLLTYALLHDPRGVVPLIFTALTLWFFGGELERRWGLRRLGLLALAATLMGSVLVTLVARLVYLPFGFVRVLGPSAASAALAVAWGRSMGERRMSFFGLAELTGRQFSYVMAGLVLLGVLMARDGGAVASVGGLVAGFVFGRRAKPPRARTVSSPRLKVVRGGKDLPN